MNQAQDLIMLQSIGIDPSKVLCNGNRITNAAFVFARETPTEDGDADFFLEAEHIKISLNYILAQAGLVYPTFILYSIPPCA